MQNKKPNDNNTIKLLPKDETFILRLMEEHKMSKVEVLTILLKRGIESVKSNPKI